MVDLLAVEVALHQLVGDLRDLVHQLLAVLLGPLAEVLGDLDLGGPAAPLALVDEGLHVDQVDDAAQLLLGPDRDLGGDHVRAEGGLQRLERGEEVGALAVEHVDEDEPRQALPVGAPPEPLGADLDPADAVDDDDRGVGDPQRGDRVGDEARLARGVEQVDLAPLVLEAGESDVYGHTAQVLVLGVVGDGRARRRRCRAG